MGFGGGAWGSAVGRSDGERTVMHAGARPTGARPTGAIERGRAGQRWSRRIQLAAVVSAAGLLAGCNGGSEDIAEPVLTSVAPSGEATTGKATSAQSETAEAETPETSEESNTDSGSSSGKKEKVFDFGNGTTWTAPTDEDGYYNVAGLGEAMVEASYPPCDGRYILIVNSIQDDGSPNVQEKLGQALLVGEPSGKEFTVPGRCASLRKQINGRDIYPVYVDFGHDVDAACRAKAQYSGNVRPLKNGNFADNANVEVDTARLALDPCK
ncbi:hypothetical protein [Corynebacterium aquatimens]|uniref:Uncharacterized protein n=1 Tax=Corynebacterium aquatimens TaxID=1190508 RepID=A0A931E2E8_9CORY|nr:hypothetical protein [Corynebacterium aquatimens]MBG6122335.1 hypothetical protein [Corynebacterium aquatimens]WJY65122.1 hypothetical protein CAQUA_01945 [Corynebacterium aquatimens]